MRLNGTHGQKRTARWAEPAPMAAAAPRTGSVVCVFAPKGGLGTTFLATHLAVLFAGRAPFRTALVDLNVHLGDAATYLNAHPQATFVDAIGADGCLEPGRLEASWTNHPTGVRLLAAPGVSEEAEPIAARHVAELLTRTRPEFDFVVVDLMHQLDGATLEALDRADHILLVAALDVGTICNVRRALEAFARLGYDDGRLKLVVNRFAETADSQRFERSFGRKIDWRIPSDYAAAVGAINAGVPVGQLSPHSQLNESLVGLAARLSGRHLRRPQATSRRPQGLWDRLRRA